MKSYPLIDIRGQEDLIELAFHVTKERPNDIKDFDNLQNRFMSGRKVGIIPIGAATTSSDRVGDFNFDEDYFYIVVNNSGTAEWRRIAYAAW